MNDSLETEGNEEPYTLANAVQDMAGEMGVVIIKNAMKSDGRLDIYPLGISVITKNGVSKTIDINTGEDIDHGNLEADLEV